MTPSAARPSALDPRDAAAARPLALATGAAGGRKTTRYPEGAARTSDPVTRPSPPAAMMADASASGACRGCGARRSGYPHPGGDSGGQMGAGAPAAVPPGGWKARALPAVSRSRLDGAAAGACGHLVGALPPVPRRFLPDRLSAPAASGSSASFFGRSQANQNTTEAP